MAPFHVRRLTEHLLTRVGLRPTTTVGPREGEKKRTHDSEGPNTVSGIEYVKGFREEDARLIYNDLPRHLKDAPPNSEVAKDLSLLSQMGGMPTADSIRKQLMGKQAILSKVEQWNSAGTPIFDTELEMQEFIVFLFENMDNGHRVLWENMTGYERNEWYAAFWRCPDGEEPCERAADRTVGLMGTDPERILDTPASLRRALENSPSLKIRGKPAHVADDNWGTEGGRNLDGAFANAEDDNDNF